MLLSYKLQYTILLEKWKSTFDKGKHVATAFLDISKVLDTINHNVSAKTFGKTKQVNKIFNRAVFLEHNG